MDQVQQLESQANKHLATRNFTEAKLALEQAIKAAQSSPTQNLIILGRLLNNMGFACRETGDYPRAEVYFQQALDIYHQIGNPDNPEMAITLQHLGRMAHRKKNYDIAWKYWTEALSIWKRLVLQKKEASYIHYLASCLHALGEFYADTEQYSPARKNFEQALDLRESVLPPNHPDIAENLADLGRLCAYLQDYTSARLYLKRALPLYATELGSTHPIVNELQSILANAEKQL